MSEMNQTEEIYSFAEHLAGEGADSVVLEAMCTAAAEEIEKRLKDGLTLADLGSTYVTAAGILALSLYCAAENPENIRGFKAGDLSVTYGEGEADADKLRMLAERLLAGTLQERGFGFVGVQG